MEKSIVLKENKATNQQNGDAQTGIFPQNKLSFLRTKEAFP